MPLTRSFKDTVKARADRDAAFREALFTEGVDALLAGDMDTGKAILRDYINATIMQRVHARGAAIRVLDKPHLDLTTEIGQSFLAFLPALAEDERGS